MTAMSSLHKDPRDKSPYWYCAFTNADGKRSFKSTKSTDHKKADEICRGWEHAANAGRQGTLTEVKVRQVLADIYDRIGTGEKIKFDTVATFFDEWVAAKTKTTALNTQRIYRDAVEAFKKHLGNKAQLSLTSLDKRHFESFRDEQLAGGKSNKTVNLLIGVLRAALNAARREQKILSNPAEAVESLPENSGIRERFTRPQIGDILKVADPDWKGATMLGVYHGLRLGDAANLKWSNVNFDKGLLTYTPQKQNRKRTQKSVTCAMHADVEKFLLALPVKGRQKDTALFPSLAGRRVAGSQGLSQDFIELMESAGIQRLAVTNGVKGSGRQVFDLGFHSLRHTALSEQVDAGIEKDLRKKLCGHSSDAVHSGYAKASIDTMRREINKVPSFLPE